MKTIRSKIAVKEMLRLLILRYSFFEDEGNYLIRLKTSLNVMLIAFFGPMNKLN